MVWSPTFGKDGPPGHRNTTSFWPKTKRWRLFLNLRQTVWYSVRLYSYPRQVSGGGHGAGTGRGESTILCVLADVEDEQTWGVGWYSGIFQSLYVASIPVLFCSLHSLINFPPIPKKCDQHHSITSMHRSQIMSLESGHRTRIGMVALSQAPKVPGL